MNIRTIIKEEIKKVFISESYNWQESKTPQEILKYINDLHSKGYEEDEYKDWEWINSFDLFKLENINVSDLQISALHYPLAVEYSKEISEMPPIVVDSTSMFVLDGNHRAKAAEIKGEKIIQAYVGYKS